MHCSKTKSWGPALERKFAGHIIKNMCIWSGDYRAMLYFWGGFDNIFLDYLRFSYRFQYFPFNHLKQIFFSIIACGAKMDPLAGHIWPARGPYFLGRWYSGTVTWNAYTLLLFSGWPYASISHTQPKSVLIGLMVILLCSYSLPIGISCTLYYVLICKTKRLSNISGLN